MNSFKQALNQLKNHWQQSLALGAISTLILSLTHFIPFLSAIAISLTLLLLQHLSNHLISQGHLKSATLLKKDLPPFFVVALILFPTSVLFGSSLGILGSPQSVLASAPAALGLLILSSYFYLVLAHALRHRLEDNVGIAKSIDVVGLASIKNFKMYFIISFYLAVLILISGITKGFGFVFSLPLVFYSTYFSYQDAKDFWPK